MRRLRAVLRVAALTCVLAVIPGSGPSGLLSGPLAGGNDADRADRRLGRKILGETRSALEQGDFAIAQVRLDSLLAMDPDNMDATFLGAKIRLAVADTVGAEVILSEGIAQAPLSGRLKLLSARILLARGRSVEAGELVSGVLAVKPGHPEALYLAGDVALARADTIQALDLWEKVLDAELGGGK